MNNCHFRDSETFEYVSKDEHRGRHIILRTMLPDPPETGNYLMTVKGDTYYIWSVKKTMNWIYWDQDFTQIEKRFLKLERKHLPNIHMGHDGFYACMEHRTLLGSEIEIIPRLHYPLGDGSEKWIVDLVIPTGSETCTFYVFGKERIGWMARHARFDEPLIIALRKFNFQEVVI